MRGRKGLWAIFLHGAIKTAQSNWNASNFRAQLVGVQLQVHR